MTFSVFIQNNIWTILFYTAVILIIVLLRRKFEWQSKFIGLYKTKIGLKAMKRLSRHKRFFKTLGYFGIFFGFLGMLFIIANLLWGLYKLLFTSNGSAVIAPVIPGFTIPGFGITVPLIIGWLALFVVILVHEFAHGVIAKAHGLKVKSSGLLVFGPILGAFVEPDEKKLQKSKDKVQLSVFAAGPFSNMLFAFIFKYIIVLVIVPLLLLMTFNAGVNLVKVVDGSPAELAGLSDGTIITSVNGIGVSTVDDMLASLKNMSIGDTVVLGSEDNRTFSVIAEENPKEKGDAYLGINMNTHRRLKNPSGLNKVILSVLSWLNEFLFWLVLLNIGIGLANLLPLGPVDGGRMLQTVFRRWLGKSKGDYWWKKVTILMIALIIILLLLPFLHSFGL